ncbi:hypothetical protein GQ44DRAFT_685499 [Phaeosphaeriaceae sp. PMI808]|nr:hypothetical protein GQ44DRAFT_685499 [Phaeosphaeriaceae sp. PMI808]
MSPSRILDTHIHLWPATSLTPHHHSWMTPNHILTKRHGPTDYIRVTTPSVQGFIYVETDRYLPSPSPGISPSDPPGTQREKLGIWAAQPLDEVRYLRRLIEGKPEEGDGGDQGSELLKGCVVWAPFHLPSTLFKLYLALLKETAGSTLWPCIVGFRYLLQGKGEGEVGRLVSSPNWLGNLVGLGEGRGGKGWVFDVGADVNRDGVQGLEDVVGMIGDVRQRGGGVRFILNHFCKPNFSRGMDGRWRAALEKLGADEGVFIKLSGAFNEFGEKETPGNVDDLVSLIKPFSDVVFSSFPHRIMFGSDWAVCNVGGPKGEQGNWKYWVEIIERVLEEQGLGEVEKDEVWCRTGCQAYGVDV